MDSTAIDALRHFKLCFPNCSIFSFGRCLDVVAETINITVKDVPTHSVFEWIVIMSTNGIDNEWNLPWNQFKNGFSLSETDFWFGLETIHEMKSSGNYKLRIEMYIKNPRKGFTGWKSVEYKSFLIDSESTGYVLTVDR